MATVSAFVYLATLLTMPLIGRNAIDHIRQRDIETHITPFIVGLLSLALVRALAGGSRKLQAARLHSLIGGDLRYRLSEHIGRLSFSHHERFGAGELLARASSDVTAIETGLSMVPFTIQSIALGIGGAVILVIIDVRLAAALLTVVALAAAVTFRAAPPLNRASRELQGRTGRFTSFVEQAVGGIEVVRGQGFERRQIERGRRAASAVRDAGTRVSDLQARYFAASLAIPAAGMAVVIGFGGYLAFHGSVTPGDLFAFLQYLWTFIAPVMIGTQALSVWPQALAGAGRVAEVLETQPDVVEPPDAVPLPAGPGHISYEGVRFGYEGGHTVLDGFSLDIPGGTCVALVGPTGCGKSTVARLLPRFYDPESGAVLLDGEPVHRLRLAELRSSIGIVFQETALFTATLRENIALGARVGTDADIDRAVELACLTDLVRELPHGLDTVIQAQAGKLSGGQRQRIAIARALVRDPRVLILDDATSALDPATDVGIRRGMVEVIRGRTTIIIAHKPETIALADVVVLMDRGRVEAMGTHDELVAHPLYRTVLGISARRPMPGAARGSAA